MNDAEQRAAAKQFAQDWQARGDEKQDNQSFWLALLQKVFGVAEPEKYINFEYPVLVDDGRKEKGTTKFIDGYIAKTRVLIEQKGRGIDLTIGYRQIGRIVPNALSAGAALRRLSSAVRAAALDYCQQF